MKAVFINPQPPCSLILTVEHGPPGLPQGRWDHQRMPWCDSFCWGGLSAATSVEGGVFQLSEVAQTQAGPVDLTCD